MSEKFINTFDGGLDSDTAPNFRRNNTYSDAVNITLNTTGKYSVATNIKGTEAAGTIANSTNFPSGSKVLSVIQVSGVIADFQTDVNDYLLIFVYTSTDYLKIYLNKIHTSSVFLLFSELQTTPYTSLTTIDTVSYSENGIDTVYFTDNINELRQITINVPAGADTTNGYITERDLSVLRRGVSGNITAYGTSTGSLLCGSYQFSFRLLNPETRKFTKWSILTPPFNISEESRGDFTRIRGGINQYSGKSIQLAVSTTSEEEAVYTHYQISCIEYIGVSKPTTAKLLQPEALDSSLSYTYNHISNLGVQTFDISEIVVDKAAIKACKTLTIKDNRLFLGNITYYDLDYDNGDPSATGSITTTISGTTDMSIDDLAASKYKGYKRGEVYRFGITYFDEFYNFSKVKVLDLNSITDNQISGSIPDVKFPTPADDVKWGLFSKSTGRTQSLNLSLTIDDHPSWAKGFVIVRANRIKRVEFQTPMIPATKINGATVHGDYPTLAQEGNPQAAVAYDTASPMNPLGTWVPKNFFFGGNRRVGAVASGQYWGEDQSTTVYYIANQNNQYDTSNSSNTSTLSLSGGSCELIDVAFLKYDYTNYGTIPSSATPATHGGYAGTNTHGTFYAVNVDDYYYSGTSGVKSSPATTTSDYITDYTYIPQNSSGALIGGDFISSYDTLITDNVQLGTPPTAQRLSAIKLVSSREDIAYKSQSGLSVPGGSIDASHFPTLSFSSDNTFAFDRTNGVKNSDYVNAIEIMDIVNTGVGDDRYGSIYTDHEYIQATDPYIFSAAELINVQSKTTEPISLSVWGGDTYTGLHQFKITDSHYGIQDRSLSAAINIERWDRFFKDYNGDILRLAVPYSGLSQVISVVIESNVRGSVIDTPTYDRIGGTITGTETIALATLGSSNSSSIRSPFNYYYHPAYSHENSDKIFTIQPETSLNIVSLNSRVNYSNERIFSSDIVGFDTFNVLDYYDLSENSGEINKLIINKDKLLALQQDGVFYIPVNSRVLESSDALSLSVRSSEVIDRPISISNIFGSQSTKSSIQADNSVYVVDSKRATVYKVTTDNLIEPISYLGVKTLIEDNGLIDGHISYNPTNGNIYIFSGDICYLYDDVKSQWQSRLDFNDNILHTLFIGESTRLLQNYASGMYALGTDQTNALVAGVIDKKTDSLLHFGAALPNAFIKFTVNPNPHISKTFDTIVLNSSAELASMSVTGFTPLSPSSSTLPLTLTDSGEGSQFVKILRDVSGKRIRGARSLMTVNWADDTVGDISLSAIITKYRESQKI